MRKWALIVALVAAIVGATLSILSTTQHIRIQREGLITESYCAISETINCDVVNASSYSEFLGVPIAWWGFIFYFLMAAFTLFGLMSKKDARPTVAIAWFMSIGSIFYSAFLAYIAIVILNALCLECMGMYLANVLLFIFLFVALKVPPGKVFGFIGGYVGAVFGKGSEIGFKPNIIKHAIVIAVAFLVGWIGIASTLAGSSRLGKDVDVNDLVKYFYMQSLYDVKVDPTWSMWGNPDAKVTIVEYSEYQCPFCKLAAFNVKPYIREYGDDVRLFFVNFPLDSECNPEVSGPMHPVACYAARAGICAEKFGDFWSFHDEMFRDQRKLSKDIILDFAQKRGWRKEEFESCIASDEVKARLSKELASGKDADVTGTPTIFMNGRKLKYWKSPRFLREVVKEELKRVKENKEIK